ncbi:hypothetical protein [Salipaludibacillus aurantiacus]|uniref:Uncharacterized protein n=1 Tax=Salipaludibacillus aurantiacus TaxID=1601833 RepID=A0A1H9PHV3_9BACI|nr:hypothetical protein [Salipaludibacillus aurantiacus]SER47670.1 hypothetical protein SAMN05518684_101320 [Salipaludibacillus aurantiacus]
MHSKQTVRYFCEKYPSGNCYYYKQEIITCKSWNEPGSLQWGRKRPVTKQTFMLRKKEGYKCQTVACHKSPAAILPFRKVKA